MLGWTVTAEYANAARSASQANPRTTTATRTTPGRLNARENTAMPAVSQGLANFANQHRQPAAPGIEVIDTPRYRITLQPDFPIPGPNSIAWIRCQAGEAEDVIREARAAVAARAHVPIYWILDPETQPPDFADYLVRHGVDFDSEAAVMVLPIESTIDGPDVDGLQIQDVLADRDGFRSAGDVNSQAFGSQRLDDEVQERRRKNNLAAGNRRVLLATLDGEPAGAAGLTLWPPDGAILNGGAVLPKFRGRGVYRALVAARLAMAREAGVEGLAVWGGKMSAPILARFGFVTVGWRNFYLDNFTGRRH